MLESRTVSRTLLPESFPSAFPGSPGWLWWLLGLSGRFSSHFQEVVAGRGSRSTTVSDHAVPSALSRTASPWRLRAVEFTFARGGDPPRLTSRSCSTRGFAASRLWIALRISVTMNSYPPCKLYAAEQLPPAARSRLWRNSRRPGR